MESVLEIMAKTKRTRTKDETVAALETENAILHLRIAQLSQHALSVDVEQLQDSVKKLFLSKTLSLGTGYSERCKNCDAVKRKTAALSTQTQTMLLSRIQLLREQLRELHLHCSSLKRQIDNKLKEFRSIVPAILQHQANMEINVKDLQTKYFRERCRRKALHNALVELCGNIRVHCRVRPVLEMDKGTVECVTCADDETVVVSHSQSCAMGKILQNKAFEFDRVHPASDSQSAVFSEIQPLIVSLLDGYNVCIMAYGQTGSGKTHTILGTVGKQTHMHQANNYGVVPLAAQELFRLVEERGEDVNMCVTVMEIYNEKIRDLLAEGQDNSVRHEIISSRNGCMDVTNLTKRPVSSSKELISTVHFGMKQRAVGSTKIHHCSSRSHLIITVHINQMPSSGLVSTSSSANSFNDTITPVHSRDSTPMVSPEVSPPFSLQHNYNSTCHNTSQRGKDWLNVKLQFVDLAGSECVAISGVSGKSLKETKHINRSLSSLSDVLGALAEKRTHIPYRNSTLTHLLKDTIGGSAKMVMLLCVSPTVKYVGESLRVLGFGQRARQVQRRRASCSKRANGRRLYEYD